MRRRLPISPVPAALEVRIEHRICERPMVTNISRRETLGLGLGAGLSATMTGAEAAQAAPSNVAFTLLLVNDIYNGGGQGPRRLRQARRDRQGGAGARRADAVLPCRRHLLALADVGLRPGRAHRRAHQHDQAGRVRARQPRVRFRQGHLLQAHGGGELPLLRRQHAPGGRLADPGHEGPPRSSRSAPSRSASSASRSRRRRRCRSRATSTSVRSSRPLQAQAEALRRQGADIIVARRPHRPRRWTTRSCARALVDVLLTGHDHDLAIGYDGKTVMVESNEEGNFVTAIDFAVAVDGRGQGPQGHLVAELPRPRFADRRARSRGAGGGRSARGRALARSSTS